MDVRLCGDRYYSDNTMRKRVLKGELLLGSAACVWAPSGLDAEWTAAAVGKLGIPAVGKLGIPAECWEEAVFSVVLKVSG